VRGKKVPRQHVCARGNAAKEERGEESGAVEAEIAEENEEEGGVNQVRIKK
jgi:hypothetical protein